MNAKTDLLIEVKDLKTYFYLDEGTVKAVDGATYDIYRGKTLGVVGESGCGKSVTARSILRIVDRPGKIVGGQVLYHDKISPTQTEVIDLVKLNPNGDRIRKIRGADISMIFQEPMTSFSPIHSIGDQIIEGIYIHQQLGKNEARNAAIEMLQKVGMPQPERQLNAYPHQLSGGMRQRAMIAMALVCHPKLLLADEPTTALDVTTQAQIIEIMRQLQQEMQMGIVMITHDLGVIAELADTVVVFYLGKVVEVADVVSLFRSPSHPYTQALLNSIPKIGRKTRSRLQPIEGLIPNPYARPNGCAFHPRCSQKIVGLCDQVEPPLIDQPGDRKVRCLLYNNKGQG